ncbi:hypothetical protein WJX73_008767 [Symbiochloris irregularis]|uniref:Desiccation-related protein PCC13-62 n=1 Tax=Symbiochloris irregularis TaxID=706552 RepID=A0AAW1NVJ6_9CHLO
MSSHVLRGFRGSDLPAQTRACVSCQATRRHKHRVLHVMLLFAALKAITVSAGRSLEQSQTPQNSDVDSLNFALNLEYIQAEFYSCAATGRPIPDDLRGGGPPSTGCKRANLTQAGQAFASELAEDELNHIKDLQMILGALAAPIPQLNIGTAFAEAGNLAFNATLDPSFSPYIDDIFLYQGAFLFEDVGVTALQGLLLGIKSESYRHMLDRIMAVEAYHGGVVRTLLYQTHDTMTPYNIPLDDAVQKLALLRGKIGAGNGHGIVNDTASSMGERAILVAADSQGLAYQRNPLQAIAILTLGAGSNGGGFFPNGLSGSIPS